MTINRTTDGNELRLELVGRLDTAAVPALEAELKQNLMGKKKLDFDLGRLEYISAAGLRVMLTAQKTMNRQGKMVIRNVGGTVMDAFVGTGLSDILTIES